MLSSTTFLRATRSALLAAVFLTLGLGCSHHHDEDPATPASAPSLAGDPAGEFASHTGMVGLFELAIDGTGAELTPLSSDRVAMAQGDSYDAGITE
ncbi:MAG: hypothetical protein ABI743_14740, partial [bacterium]